MGPFALVSTMSATAEPVMMAPMTYIQEGAPVTYVQEGAPVTYLQEGAPVTYLQEGMPVTYLQEGAPMTYMTAEGMPMMYAVQQPARFNISPEKFAILAAGGSLTQEEINEMLSPEGSVAATTMATTVATTAATTATTTAATTKSSKKKVKVSKKKKSGCC